MVCSGVLEVPFGPECFGGGNFAGEGATTMRKKKAVRSRTILKKHNIQDTRVTVDSECSHSNEGRSSRLKRIRQAVEGLLIRQVLLEVWERKLEYWEDACDFVGKLLEVVFS